MIWSGMRGAINRQKPPLRMPKALQMRLANFGVFARRRTGTVEKVEKVETVETVEVNPRVDPKAVPEAGVRSLGIVTRQRNRSDQKKQEEHPAS